MKFALEAIRQFETWGEISSLDGFSSPVVNKAVEAPIPEWDAVEGYYRLPKENPQCGWCGTRHHFGLVFKTTSGGRTNIGNECASQRLGPAVKLLVKRLDKAISRNRRRAVLNETLLRRDTITARVERVLTGPRGAEWAHMERQKFMREDYSFAKELLDRCQRGSVGVTKQRERTFDELEMAMLIADVSVNDWDDERVRAAFRYESVEVGKIEGWEILSESPKNVLVENILHVLDDLESVDPLKVTDTKLAKLANDVLAFESTFSKADRLINACEAFIQPSNLELVAMLHDQRRR